MNPTGTMTSPAAHDIINELMLYHGIVLYDLHPSPTESLTQAECTRTCTGSGTILGL
jgi:hypothetical protein